MPDYRPAYDWSGDAKPDVPWARTIFYETHVRGFTKLHPAIPENLRGTFEGLGQKAIVDYVKSLGITSIELLPIHAFLDDEHLMSKGPHATTGATTRWRSSRRAALSRPRWPQRIARHGARLPRRQHRGDPRRGLQPHRRRQRAGPDAVVQGHRQLRLLPHDAGQPALLHQRHRHRQHGQHLASARAADGDRTRCAIGRPTCMSTASASTSAPSWPRAGRL